MKSPVLLFLAILIASLINSNTYAQEQKPAKKGTLEISIGFNAFGPNSEMDKIMVVNGFDATTNFSFFGFGKGDEIEHPHYNKIGFSAQLTYSRYFTSKSQWGLMLSYSYFDEIWGATENGSLLGIDFSNVSIIPIYRYDLVKILELQAGPALLINIGNKITGTTYDTPEDFTTVAPGLLCGLNMKLWNTPVTCGKLGTSYLFAAKSKMGPYSASNYAGNTSTLPESEIGFGHLMVYFSIGFHL